MRLLALPLAFTCLVLLFLTGCSDQVVDTTEVDTTGSIDPSESTAVAVIPEISPGRAETIKATPAFVENQAISHKLYELLEEIKPDQIEEWKYNRKDFHLFLEERGLTSEGVARWLNTLVNNGMLLDKLYGIDHHVVAVLGSIDQIASGTHGADTITPCEEACRNGYARQLILNDIELWSDMQVCYDLHHWADLIGQIGCAAAAYAEHLTRDRLADFDLDMCIADCQNGLAGNIPRKSKFQIYFKPNMNILKEASVNSVGLQKA